MMANQTCTNCGTELIAGAKFCRLCGQPSAGGGERNVLEAETQTLHAPTAYSAAPTDYLQPQPTSPAYLAPGQMPYTPAANYNTGSIEPRGKKKRTALVIGLLAVLLLVPLISLVVFAVIRSQTSSMPVMKKIIISKPDAPSAPPVIQPEDKTVPPPPPSTAITKISPALIYPGAQTRMEITSGEGGAMMQLRTDDPYEKVLNWYIDKVKPSNIVKTPKVSSSILRTGNMMVLITGEGGETNILIKQGGDDDEQ